MVSKIEQPAEFELVIKSEGKTFIYEGTGDIKIDVEPQYGEAYSNVYLDPVAYFKTGTNTKIAIDSSNVIGTYRVKMKEAAVEKSIKISVADRTFENLAKARKSTGAPRHATFEYTETVEGAYSRKKDLFVTFTWNEDIDYFS